MDIGRSSFAFVKSYTLARLEMLYFLLDARRHKKVDFFKDVGSHPSYCPKTSWNTNPGWEEAASSHTYHRSLSIHSPFS